MDYAPVAEIARHADWTAFAAQRTGRLALLTTRGDLRLQDAGFRADDVLLFGSEGAGVPDAVHEAADLRVRIPLQPGFRSLNLAVAAGIALAEALRQAGALPD
jgi:tRNA (cytidine/uridine-2'-O-)-methyltransferase